MAGYSTATSCWVSATSFAYNPLAIAGVSLTIQNATVQGQFNPNPDSSQNWLPSVALGVNSSLLITESTLLVDCAALQDAVWLGKVGGCKLLATTSFCFAQEFLCGPPLHCHAVPGTQVLVSPSLWISTAAQEWQNGARTTFTNVSVTCNSSCSGAPVQATVESAHELLFALIDIASRSQATSCSANVTTSFYTVNLARSIRLLDAAAAFPSSSIVLQNTKLTIQAPWDSSTVLDMGEQAAWIVISVGSMVTLANLQVVNLPVTTPYLYAFPHWCFSFSRCAMQRESGCACRAAVAPCHAYCAMYGCIPSVRVMFALQHISMA